MHISIRAMRTLLRDSSGDYLRTSLAGPDRGKPIRNGAPCMHDVHSIGAIGAREMRLFGLSMALPAKED